MQEVENQKLPLSGMSIEEIYAHFHIPTNEKDDIFDISIRCLSDNCLSLIKFTIWFNKPLGKTSLFCKNHDLSIEIVIINTLQANKGHINGPPAMINSFIGDTQF